MFDFLKRPRVYWVYTHDNSHKRFRHGLKANTEISYWIGDALKKKFGRYAFLRLQNEKDWRINKIREQDIVVGHFGDTFLKASHRTKRLITFAPWSGHEDRSVTNKVNCINLENEKKFYDSASSIILLTSEFNQKRYLDQVCNFWHPYFKQLKERGKRVRVVHQPIDFSLFPRIKWTYETNEFIYIGNDNHMKCVPDSKKLVAALGKELHTYGIGGKNLDHLDKRAVSDLPKIADFFIQPGMWEAQCVSIIEAAARGFIPLVTPETGYPCDHPYLLKYGDFDYNLAQLRKVLSLSRLERQSLANDLHYQLINDPKHNDWSQLTRVVVEEVSRLW